VVLVGLAVCAPEAGAIFNGRIAKVSAWPWTVQVLRDEPGMARTAEHFCGGSLLAPEWVLTAGHCVTDEDGAIRRVFSVAVGRQRAGGTDGTTVHVAGVLVHPEFDRLGNDAADNDVALLWLADDVRGKTIRLAGPADREHWRVGKAGSVLGWGLTEPGAVDPSTLRRGAVPIAADDDCAETARRWIFFNLFESETMLCAGLRTTPRDEACNRDSGGPLTVRGASGQRVQVGVVSWGVPCAQPDLPTIYARVGEGPLRKWIAAQTQRRIIRFAEDGRVRAMGRLRFDGRSATTIAHAIKAFGKQPRYEPSGVQSCDITWPDLGLTLYSLDRAAGASGRSPCGKQGVVQVARISGPAAATWRTDRKLRLLATRDTMRKRYGAAHRESFVPAGELPEGEIWGLVRHRVDFEDGASHIDTLWATVDLVDDRITSFYVTPWEGGI
jgi:secreted trypsin-like serine protease